DTNILTSKFSNWISKKWFISQHWEAGSNIFSTTGNILCSDNCDDLFRSQRCFKVDTLNMSIRVCAINKCSIEAILGSRDIININSLPCVSKRNMVKGIFLG